MLYLGNLDYFLAGVQGVYKVYSRGTAYLGPLPWDELGSNCRGDGQEGDGEPADKVREDKQRHPLRNLRIVRVPGLRPAYRAVHLSKTRNSALEIMAQMSSLQGKEAI